MLDQQQQIGDLAGAAFLDQGPLQRQRLPVWNPSEPPYLELSHDFYTLLHTADSAIEVSAGAERTCRAGVQQVPKGPTNLNSECRNRSGEGIEFLILNS